MQVYVVISADYAGNYDLGGVYSTHEQAEHANKLLGGNYEIVPTNLDDIVDAPPGFYWYCVRLSRDESVEEVSLDNRDSYVRHHPEGEYDMLIKYGDTSTYGVFYVWARNSKEAIRIATARKVSLITTGQWPAHLGMQVIKVSHYFYVDV